MFFAFRQFLTYLLLLLFGLKFIKIEPWCQALSLIYQPFSTALSIHHFFFFFFCSADGFLSAALHLHLKCFRQLSCQFPVPSFQFSVCSFQLPVAQLLNFGRSFGTLLIVGRSGSSVYLFGFASVLAIPFAVSRHLLGRRRSRRLRFWPAKSVILLKLNYLE